MHASSFLSEAKGVAALLHAMKHHIPRNKGNVVPCFYLSQGITLLIIIALLAHCLCSTIKHVAHFS